MIEDKPGWTGPEIPLGAQAMVLMRKYRAAVSVVSANVELLRRQIDEVCDVEDPMELPKRLAGHPFFMKTLAKLEASYPEFGDASFRKSSGELFREAQDELEDNLVWVAIGLWVHDGAEFPYGLLEMYQGEDGS